MRNLDRYAGEPHNMKKYLLVFYVEGSSRYRRCTIGATNDDEARSLAKHYAWKRHSGPPITSMTLMKAIDELPVDRWKKGLV